MQRHLKARSQEGYLDIVPPGTMRFLDFARLNLQPGERYFGGTGTREYVLDFFSGIASIAVEDAAGKTQEFNSVGGRSDVFSGAPVMLYMPPRSAYEIKATAGKLDVGMFSAPSQATAPAALLHGPDVVRHLVGQGNWQRTVYSALAENVPAERLLAGETLNPPGNWSSYPPHKHDRSNPPQEAVLEEIYFFRLKPAQRRPSSRCDIGGETSPPLSGPAAGAMPLFQPRFGYVAARGRAWSGRAYREYTSAQNKREYLAGRE